MMPIPALSLLLDVECDRWQAALGDRPAKAVVTAALEAGMAELQAAGEHPWLARLPAGMALEISVLLTDDAAVRELNRDHRGKDKPTNILSFPQYDTAELWTETGPTIVKGIPALPLGDMAAAFETVETEAKARDIPVWEHLSHLLVHSLLHLAGHDHVDDRLAQRMEQLERQALNRLGLDDPYRFDLAGMIDQS